MTLHFSDLLRADDVFVDVDAGSKKHALQLLSHALADIIDKASDDDVFQALLDRERLGCTASSGGVALPHARIGGIDSPRAALIRLQHAIDFDSTDAPDVDVLFGFLLPLQTNADEDEQLRRLTDAFLDLDAIASMRDAPDAQSLYGALIGLENHVTSATTVP
ncbi:MAG: PTS sugar transporter subunit IIA [Pseudomonadota bacterium]